MSEEPDFVPLSEYDRAPRRRGHSPFIVNGKPADLQPLPVVDPVAWDGKEIPDRPWLVRDLIPMQNTTLISGHGGTGKSTLVLDLLVCASLGLPWLGLETKRVNCVGFFAEDDRDELQRRLGSILRHHGREFADLEALTLLDRVDQPNMLMQWENKWQPGQPANLFTRLSNTLDKTGAQLLVIDSLYNVFTGDKLEERHAWEFMAMLRGLARQMDGAIVMTYHPSQSGLASGSGEFGSVGWHNACRSRLFFTSPKCDGNEDYSVDDMRELRPMKANYSARTAPIRLRWETGVFVKVEQTSSPTGFVDKLALDNVVLSVAADLIRDGAKLLANKNATNGLANLVRKDERCRAHKWAAVAAAQERLMTAGRLVRVELGPKSRRMVYVQPADARYPGEEG